MTYFVVFLSILDRRFKECQLCGKQVLHTSLSNHMKLHSSERYSCSVCKKSFARKDYCLKHMFAVHQKMSRADLQY